MADSKTPQEQTDDMSIDELSAAIDAHMDEIEKPAPKKLAAKIVATPKTKVKTSAKKSSEPKPKEEGGTKIAVKHSYVSKTA